MAQQMLLLAVAVIAVIVVSVLLVQCHNSKGNTYTEPTHFCGTCQGLGQKVCTDRPALDRLYRDGTLNETSHLFRGNQWPVTMPADKFHRIRTSQNRVESYQNKDDLYDHAATKKLHVEIYDELDCKGNKQIVEDVANNIKGKHNHKMSMKVADKCYNNHVFTNTTKPEDWPCGDFCLFGCVGTKNVCNECAGFPIPITCYPPKN